MWVKLDGLKHPIQFKDTGELVDILQAVLRGWRITRMDQCDELAMIQVSKGPKGYERRSPWLKRGTAIVQSDPVDAVCDLLLDIEHALIEDSIQGGGEMMLTLHAAGVLMGANKDAGLVVFPSTHASGKSLLSTALAARGHRVFADDQLPIVPAKNATPAQGVSPGFIPRLRRPLPGTVDANIVDFIHRHQGPMSKRYRYVNLDEKLQAPVGEHAPIKAMVLLNRKDGEKPSLKPASDLEAFKACILQSFGRKLSAIELLDNLQVLVQGINCHTLTYSNAQDAVKVLKYTFD